MKKLKQKRTEAEARQAKHDMLTIEEKLSIIDTRPGRSRKERAKLLP